jgi:hypothetical protein
MSDNMYFEVATMGDFQVGRKKIRTRTPRPLDTGCFWFRDCEKCGWEGCVTQFITRYDSVKGRELRGQAFAWLLGDGIPMSWLVRFFGVTEEQVKAESGPYKAKKARPNERREEAIRMRQQGQPVAQVASALGVSSRQVMYWCQGASGIVRVRWNGTVEASVIQPDDPMRQRCKVLRAVFK